MASSNTANWSVYSRNGKANVEELLWWFQGPKYLQFALRATRIHLTPTSYQQSRQLFIRHKLAHQSKIRELPPGKPKSNSWERRDGLWLTALPFAQSSGSIPSNSVASRRLQTATQHVNNNTTPNFGFHFISTNNKTSDIIVSKTNNYTNYELCFNVSNRWVDPSYGEVEQCLHSNT